MNRYNKMFISATTTAVLVSAVAAPTLAASFTDVAPRYKEAVNFVVSKGVEGFSNTQFGVYHNIKRVDAAIMLAKVLELDIENAPASGFTDVPARGVPYVNALKAAGIVNGVSDTKFDAHSMITRGEIALWLRSGFNLEGSADIPFTDVAPQYQQAVSALVENKITDGLTPTRFGTDEHAIRGDYAIFLYRASKVDKGPKPQLDTSYDQTPPAISTPNNGIYVNYGRNNTEFMVKFDIPVDKKSAENIENYQVEGATVQSATLVNDDTVLVRLNHESIDKSGYRCVTIQGVKSRKGVEMDPYATTDYFLENYRPYVESADLITKDKIQITFSEPINRSWIRGENVNVFVGAVQEAEGAGFAIKPSSGSTVQYQESYIITLVDDLTEEELAQTITVETLSDESFTYFIMDRNGNKTKSERITVTK